MVSTHHERPAGVTRRFQVAEDAISAASTQGGHVLGDDPPWTQAADEPGELAPESAAGAALDADAFARTRDVLTGKPSDDGVDIAPPVAGELVVDEADVAAASDVWPVSLKHGARIGVHLHLSHTLPASPLQAEVKATDAGEEREESHHSPRSIAAQRARVCSAVGMT